MVLERAELDQAVLDLAAPARGELDQEELGQVELVQGIPGQEMFGLVVVERAETAQETAQVGLFQKVPDQGVPVREELRRGTLGLQELRRVVLVQEEREKPGQVGLA